MTVDAADNKEAIISGPCLGGPYNGRRLTHTSTRYPLMTRREVKGKTVSAPLGEYVFDDGAWRWKGS